jgi:hypothetical protein
MKRAEFEQFCLACARDLEPKYGDGLVPHVETALWGGARSGSARHMGIPVSIADLSGIGTLLVSMLGTAIAYVEMKRGETGGKSSKPEETEQTSPVPTFSADVTKIEQAFSEAIADLGREQQAAAKALAREICAWMRDRSNR